ncbi:hypothetical protein RND71_001671 [Anisodus tanguticus]|uniref:protein-serine/threonine phosphatase n=1 Tax=Anisodus tanguticus TaxID=243964 RepID=A0AAE1VY87_9SOLA|nr:hypothetical protein RND71_001671 [Anisodus tanguticus]
MGAEAEVMVQLQHTIPVLDVPSVVLIWLDLSNCDVKSPETTILQFTPSIRSGSFADTGPRRFMEDEHIRIDDLSAHLGSLMRFRKPSDFYGVFDGHGGPEAAAYVTKNVLRLFFRDTNFPETSEVDDAFLEGVESSLRKGFLLADLALADDCNVSSSSGTTALTALVLGSEKKWSVYLNLLNCALPSFIHQRRRVEDLGGFIDDGYLNGILSVTRALGDWDMKLPRGSASPLIAEPEFRQIVLTEEDEFLIIGCDGIWDVMSSQQAVTLVRRGLRRHDDPEQCAKDLVMSSQQAVTFDNLTVIIVCFTSPDHGEVSPMRPKEI